MSSTKSTALASDSVIPNKIEVDRELAEGALTQFIINISKSRVSRLTKNLNFDVLPTHEPLPFHSSDLTTTHTIVWGSWGSIKLSISCSEVSALRMYSRLNPEPLNVRYDHHVANAFINEYLVYIGEFIHSFFKDRKIPSGVSSPFIQDKPETNTNDKQKRRFNPDIKLWKFTCQESPDMCYYLHADILVTDPISLLGVAVDFRTAVATEVILNEICEIEYFQ